ncbi:MAG: MmgE/PrpD family protein [Rhodospirillales bacterium]|nr:MmgE/PrpD family protein [Rhodospirillales bacterium]
MALAEATAPQPEPAPSEPIARTLARFARELTLDDVPEAVVERAKLHILDAVGIGLAASRYDFSHKTLTAIQGLAGDGSYPVIGMPVRLPLRDAAQMNGFLIHGLDYDDTHVGGVIHATTSAVPTILAAGQRHGVSGREMLEAYLVAIECAARIAAAAQGGFHRLGFHPTGMVGVFGAALAAGRLAGMTEAQLAHAQGIALSMASGSLQFLDDGAWTKRMHPGWAAVAGISAAALAQQGFQGPAEPYEGRFGLYALYGAPDAEIDWAMCTAGLGEDWEMLRIGIKPYPACHLVHALGDAAQALRDEHGLSPADVESVDALIGEGCVSVVCEPEAAKRRPANAYEAQFSAHYMIASVLERGRFTLAELEPEAYTDPAVLALCDKVSYRVDPDSAFPTYYSGEVAIRTTDGRTLRHREQVNRGADTRPLSADEIVAKYRDNAAMTLASDRAERALDAVMALDRDATPGEVAALLSLA